MQRRSLVLFYVAAAVVAALLACNLPTARRATDSTRVAATISRVQLETTTSDVGGAQAESVEPSQAPATETLPPSITPTVTQTSTPEIPRVTVSQNTNCRTGPGTVYDLVDVFMMGEEAEIVARSSVPEYVIIEVPDGSGRTCWLWMRYASTSGDYTMLPARTPPPTPTPAATPTPVFNFSVSYAELETCGPNIVLFFRVFNTGGRDLESFHLTAQDVDASVSVARQGYSYSNSVGCVVFPENTIQPGDSAYVAVPFGPSVAGHNVSLNLTVCALDDQGDPCLARSTSVLVPSPSDPALKDNFDSVDNREILELVSELPITRWNYRDLAPEAQHIGPMADDFNTLFKVGGDEGYISAVDASGVALASIQELHRIEEQQSARLQQMENDNARLQEENQALAARIDSLEARIAGEDNGNGAGILPWIALAVAVTTAFLGRRLRRHSP